MKENEVMGYMSQLEKEDENLTLFSQKYTPLASFLADYDFLKDKNHLSQKDIAVKMGTTQSAVSRIERMKTNPTYLQLKKMAEAVGGEIFLSPLSEYSLTLSVDLQKIVKSLAEKKNMTVKQYLENCVRSAINQDYKELCVDVDSKPYFFASSITSAQTFGEKVRVENNVECCADDFAA